MEAKWNVGCVQPVRPEHEAGLRWFVIGQTYPREPIAWTKSREAADAIVEALERGGIGPNTVPTIDAE